MHKSILYLCFLLAFCNAGSQTLPLKTFTSKDGLINDQVTAIIKDNRGLLWLGTPFGINWFDGKRFYEPAIQAHTGQLYVTNFYKDSSGIIWVLTFYNGIYQYANGKFNNFLPKPEQLSSTRNNVFSMLQYDRTKYLVATDDNIFWFDGQSFSFFDQSNSILDGQINSISKLKDGSVLIGVQNGLWLYRFEKNIFKQPEFLFNGHRIHNILNDEEKLWIATNKGVYYFENSAFITNKPTQIFLEGRDGTVTKGGNEEIWIVAEEIYKIKDNTLNSFYEKNDLPPNISNIYYDPQGITWFISSKGFSRLEPEYYKTYSLQGSGVNTMTICLGSDAQNNLWLGSYEGLAKKMPSGYIIHRSFNGQQLGYISWMVNLKNRTLLTGTDAGIFALTSAGLQKKNEIKSTKAFEDNEGKIWLGTEQGNVYKWENDSLSLITLTNGVRDYIDAIYKDERGNLWIGYRGTGIMKFRLNGLTAGLVSEFTAKTGFHDLRIRCSAPDLKGNLIFGTRTNGLFIISPDNKNNWHINSSKALSGNWVKSISVDEKNNIYLATNKGVDILPGNNYADPVIRNLNFSNDAIEKPANYVFIQHDTIWIANDDGLIQYLPGNYSRDTTDPKIFFTQLSINGIIDSSLVSFSAGNQTIRLPYYKNIIAFEFAGVNLKNSGLKYTYILEGQDKNWSALTERNFVNYNLPPGNYTFKVRAVNKDGVQSSLPATQQFIIAAPFWKTAWFLILCMASVIALVYFIYRYRITQVIKIEKMRGRISADLHDDLGTGLSRIKFLSETIGLKKKNNASIENDISKISAYTDEMSEKIGEIVWALNTKNDTLTDLVSYIRSYSVEYLANNNIECEAKTPLNFSRVMVNGETRRNIFLSVKESLHNIVKHAGADKVFLYIEINSYLEIIIQDNGSGIDWNNIRKFSNGLQNIRQRMKNSKGKADFISDNGTKVVLKVPLNV